MKDKSKLVIVLAFITSIIFIVSGVLFSRDKLVTFGCITAGYPIGLLIGTLFIRRKIKYNFKLNLRDIVLFLSFLVLNYILLLYVKINNKLLFSLLLFANVIVGIFLFFRLFFHKEK